MRVFLKVLAGEGKVIEIDLAPLATTEVLKQQVKDVEGIPVYRQRLVFDGRQLSKGRTLSDSGIAEGSEITLHVDAHGAMEPFLCPCDSMPFDCQKRAPVRSPCACGHLICRKCANVLASMPTRPPCELCGAPGATGTEEVEVEALKVEQGVLVALMKNLPPLEPYV